MLPVNHARSRELKRNASNGSHHASHVNKNALALQKDATLSPRGGIKSQNGGKEANGTSSTSVPTSREDNSACPPPKLMNGDLVHALDKDTQTIVSKRQAKSKGSRRAIFNTFNPRDNVPFDSATEIDIRNFTPPAGQKDALRKRYALIDEFPLDEIQRAQELPPVPSPLLRYVSEGGAGVYPLVEPKSILRQGKYSSPSSPSTNNARRLVETSNSEAVCWSTTKSFSQPRRPSQLDEFKRMTQDMSLEESKRFFRDLESQKSDGREHHVKFDPRIVITEFSNDPERAWFTEDDLNRFRHDTAVLAQYYMMLHPELAEEFALETVDPVTGKMRKKALYCMPGLCSADGIDSFGTVAEIENMVRNTIRNVLIVDPNKSILELFRKSIQQMFPSAKISGVQSGDDALRLYTTEMGRKKWDGHDRGFDVVIIEEKLSRHRAKGLQPSAHIRMRSDSLAHPTSSAQLRTLALQKKELAKQDSFSNIESLPYSPKGAEMSGSQLIRRICQLEDQFYDLPRNSDENGGRVDQADVNLFFPPQRRSLLIGVSVNVERDEKTLKESGADLVWGKPPPSMNNALRNQLISLLIAKRHEASFCVRIPGDKDSKNSI
jgi:hypothetical protein